MNKAFIREPEDTGQHHCPRCGALGEPVGRAVLEHFLRADAAVTMGELAYFCPTPSCEVAYFDPFERRVGIESLARPAYPKDRDAPICGCFGLTEDEIEADLRDGAVARIKAHLEKTKSHEARCEIYAANGRPCVADVQKYYMRRRGATG
jgi:hypothetical protein